MVENRPNELIYRPLTIPMSVPARYVVLLALVALVPAVAYTSSRSDPTSSIAAVNIVLIAASLYVAMSATSSEGADDHGVAA